MHKADWATVIKSMEEAIMNVITEGKGERIFALAMIVQTVEVDSHRI